MVVEVNTTSLEVQVRGTGHLAYCGHMVQINEDDGLALFCTSCGQSESFVASVDGLHKWESILYLLGRFPEDCDGDGSDLHERIQNILQNYVGKPADQARLAALENDIRNVVGDEIPVEVRAP